MGGGRRAKSDDLRKGGASQIGRLVKGGASQIGRPIRGAKNFGLGPKTRFFLCFWVFWALLFFGQRGGAKIFGCVVRGGERNRSVDIFGFLRGQIVCCLKMRRK